MIQCKDVAEEASRYIEGDLPFFKRIGLFFHVLICRCCQNYIQQIRTTISTISVIKPKEKTSTDPQKLAELLKNISQKSD